MNLILMFKICSPDMLRHLNNLYQLTGAKGKTRISRIEYKTENSSKEDKPHELFGSNENVGKIIDLNNP
jgi:hypothetical protein